MTRGATLRRDVAHLWELAATQMVRTGQVHCLVLCAASRCSSRQLASRGMLTA